MSYDAFLRSLETDEAVCSGCDAKMVPNEEAWVHADSGSTKCYQPVQLFLNLKTEVYCQL